MSDGQSYFDARRRGIRKCWNKIYSTTWKKEEDGYLIETTVDYKGDHKIKKTKLEDLK